MLLSRFSAALLAALGTVLLLAGPASAAAQKSDLVGPQANIFCASLEPAGEDVSQIAPGFVVFNANKNKISAVVSVKDASPSTTLPVRFIQGGPGGGDDCFTVDGVIETNAQGKGTINISEVPRGTRAQVIIDTSELTGNPTFRGSEIFVFGQE